MKYAVDQIIDNIAILENISTKDKKEIPTSLLPKNCREGNIIVKIQERYEIDKNIEEKRRKMLRNKLERIKNKKNWVIKKKIF